MAAANRERLEEAAKAKNVMQNYKEILAFRNAVNREVKKSVTHTRRNKAFVVAWVRAVKAT